MSGTAAPQFVPVDHNPFAPQLIPVDHDPFASAHPVAGPSGDFMTDVGRRVGTGAANAIAGALSLPNLAAQGIDYVGGLVGAQPWAQKSLESIPDPSGRMMPNGSPLPAFPDFQTAQNLAFQSTGGTEYQPETWAGRRLQDVINGVMSATPTTALVSGPRAALAALPATMGAAATGGQAAELKPDHPIIAATLGAIPGAALGQAMMNAPQRLMSLARGGQTTEPYGAFARLGLPTDLAGTTTGSPGLSYAEKLAARMPGSEGPVAQARDKLITAWQNKLDNVASSMGTATTPTEAGLTLQSDAQNWLKNFKQQSSDLWNKFYAKVPPGTPASVQGYQSALQNVLGAFPGAPNSAGILQPGTVANLSKALGVDLAASGGTLPIETIKSMRTAIGERLENPTTIADTSQAALRQLYGGLSNDIQTAAASVSPDALTAFHRANGFTAAGHDLLDNHLAPIIKAATPEQATQYAMQQARLGGSRLGAVTFALPNAAGDLGALALRTAATNEESPTALATAMLGRKPIYSPEAQNVLFPNPQTKADIADLAATGRAMQPFAKDLANSPTATRQTRDLGRVMAAIEMARTGHELGGVPGMVLGGAAGLLSPDLMGKLAQATALNPYAAALMGKNIPMPAQSPGRLARAIMAPTLGHSIPVVQPELAAPATSASSTPR